MTRSRRTPLLAAALLVAGSVLAGCSGSGSTAGAENGFVSGNGTITQLEAADRKKPGPVSGETLEGDAVSLEDYRSKVVVINVWGSWCPPCRAEVDELSEAAEKLAGRGVVFLGINTRDKSTADALAFQDKHDVPYSSLYDPGGRNLLAFRGTLAPNAIPSTVVIDAEGRVAASVIGEVTSVSTLVGLVEDVIG